MSPTNSKPLNVLVWSICLTAILAAMLGAATVWLVERTHTGEEWVRHVREVQNEIAQVLILTQRMETSQRGYLLTGRARYLDDYEHAEAALRAAVGKTTRLVADNARQQETFIRLRQVVADKLSELRTTINEQKAGRSDAARAMVNSDRGLQMMSEIRQLLSEMGSEEDRLLSTRAAALKKIATLLQLGAGAAFAMICALGVLVFVYLRRSFAELTVALQQREHSEARLQLALDSAQLGWWQYDPLRRVVSGDVRFKEIFGVVEDESAIEEALKRVYPDDAERVGAAREAALDPGDPKPLAIEHRIQRGDGEVRWVEAHGLAYFEGAGRERKAVRFVGTVADITERKHSENLLQRQADLLNQSHDAILMLESGGRGIVYWSRGAERLYGYAAAEAEGRTAHELLQTHAHIPIEEIDAQVIYEGSWNGELTHTTRDGREIVVESRMVRVSYDGKTFALETNRDITERKHHEEREHLLMREMNHRAKNMLGLVQAIARQTTTGNPEDFIERFSERIQALSANQELLVRNEWKGVEIEDLVRAQLSHFADLIGSRIAANGPKLRLTATSAQAIGLALHELATNAGKYGALSTEKGRVDVLWATDGGAFTMSWTERDGPPVSAPERRGFGTTVMGRMVEGSLGGKIDLDYAPSGLTWHLTCPTESSLEGNGAQVFGTVPPS